MTRSRPNSPQYPTPLSAVNRHAGTPNLRLLDHSAAGKELDLGSELFHRINRIIPQNQVLLTVAPSCRAREDVALLQQHGYSQVLVVDSGEVLGVFLFRSFARHAAGTTLDEWTK